MILIELEESRGKFVRQMGGKGHHLGAWYRLEDWDKDGNLIAKGEARLRARDPWANDRSEGRSCPPPGSSRMPDWSDYIDGYVTKLDDVTKLDAANGDATKVGRPSKGEQPMTSAERVRLHRARKADERPV